MKLSLQEHGFEAKVHQGDKENDNTEAALQKRRMKYEECGDELETPPKKRRAGGDLVDCENFDGECAVRL